MKTRASSIAGTPARSLQATPAHFSATGALVAKERATASWPACRKLIPKAVGGLDGEQGAGAAVEAGEHQHRLDRERADGVGGRSGGSVVAAGGDDRDARGQGRHRGAETGWVGRRHRQKIGIGSRQYDARRMRAALIIAMVAAALGLSACGFGEEGISVSKSDPDYNGAVLFATHCSGCHTLSAAGTQGTGNRGERTQGPNLNQRTETYEDALFAVQNGGFSGAIMPQNIVVGHEAEAVARFVAKYAGEAAESSPRPGETSP
jgi:mono/diheme cytochrome c family protein